MTRAGTFIAATIGPLKDRSAELVAGPVHPQWTAPATFVSGAPDSMPRHEG